MWHNQLTVVHFRYTTIGKHSSLPTTKETTATHSNKNKDKQIQQLKLQYSKQHQQQIKQQQTAEINKNYLIR